MFSASWRNFSSLALQGLLGLLAVGDVLAGAGEPEEFTIGGEARDGLRFDPAPLAIGAAAAAYGKEGHMVAQGALEGIEECRCIFGMNHPFPPELLNLFCSHSAELEVGTVNEAVRALGVGDPDADGGAVGHDAEALFAFLKSELGAAAVGDVSAEADVAQELAAGRESRLGARTQQTPLAIGATNAGLAIKGR